MHRSATRFAAVANEAAGPPSEPGDSLVAIEGGLTLLAATSSPCVVDFVAGFSGADANAELGAWFSAGSTLAASRVSA